MFYFSFIKDRRKTDKHFWITKLDSHTHSTWSGLAFERLCLWHVPQIKLALGIAGVSSGAYSWTYQPKNKDEEGAQIDLLIDRRDQVINLCEMKFANKEYLMTEKEEERLWHRTNVFMDVTKTRKAVHCTLVTTYGLKRNAYADVFQQVVTLDDLFREEL